jgi:hypothetical protein
MQPLFDLYSSAGWYSRYENTIGLIQARGGAEVASFRTSALCVYLRTNIGWDTKADFYNRIIELGPGLQFIPHRSWGMSITVEGLRGFYWSGSRADSPYGSAYSSIRIFLLFERPLCL